MKKNGKNNKKDKDNKTKTNNNKDIEVRCPFCGNVLEKKELNSHMEIHPSKVFDWLYIGGYNTATKKSDLSIILSFRLIIANLGGVFSISNIKILMF